MGRSLNTIDAISAASLMCPVLTLATVFEENFETLIFHAIIVISFHGWDFRILVQQTLYLRLSIFIVSGTCAKPDYKCVTSHFTVKMKFC